MLILFVIVLFAGIVFFLFQNHKKHENNSFNDVSSPSPTSSVSSDSLVWDNGKTGERYKKEALAPLFGYKKSFLIATFLNQMALLQKLI